MNNLNSVSVSAASMPMNLSHPEQIMGQCTIEAGTNLMPPESSIKKDIGIG